MLQQLANEQHQYHSQLGWGATSLTGTDIPINGFDEENNPHYKAIGAAIGAPITMYLSSPKWSILKTLSTISIARNT